MAAQRGFADLVGGGGREGGVHGRARLRGNWEKMKKCCPPRPGRGSGPALPTPVRNPGVWPCASRKTSCRTENQQVRSPGAPPGRRSRAPGRFARLPAEAGRTLAPQELPLSRWAKRGVRPAWRAEPMCIWAQPTPAPPGRAPALCEIRKVHNSIRFFSALPRGAQRRLLPPAGSANSAHPSRDPRRRWGPTRKCFQAESRRSAPGWAPPICTLRNPPSAKLDFLPRPGTTAGAQAPTGLRLLR